MQSLNESIIREADIIALDKWILLPIYPDHMLGHSTMKPFL